MKTRLYLTIFSFLFSANLEALDNPYIAMAKKNYAFYSEDLENNVYKNIYRHDFLWASRTITQMREAAHISGNKKWMLEALFFEAYHRYSRTLYLQIPDQNGHNPLAEGMIATLMPIIEQAEKIGAKDLQLRILFSIMQCYSKGIKNYEMGFHYGIELDKSLSVISVKDFPFKPVYYVEIARQYHSFREYEAARSFYEKALENPEIAQRMMVLETTWNDLGIIYRDYYNDLAASDSCFFHILEMNPFETNSVAVVESMPGQPSIHDENNMWAVIAKGNLGHNAYLRGDYEVAIPLLEYVVEKLAIGNADNFHYAAEKALILAGLSLEIIDPFRANYYLEMAYNYLVSSRNKAMIRDTEGDLNLWVQYYRLQSFYLRTLGDNESAFLYADSTRLARESLENDFNLMKLYRVEKKERQMELEMEKLRSSFYHRLFFYISAFLVVILTLLVLLVYFYWKMRRAYQDLVQKNKQWAGGDHLEKIADYKLVESTQDLDSTSETEITAPKTETITPVTEIAAPKTEIKTPEIEMASSGIERKISKIDEKIHGNREATTKYLKTNNGNEKREPTEKEVHFTARIHQMMVGQHVYRDSNLSLESLAQLLGVNRETVSRSINRTTGKNFSHFLNEYRIKEAVRLLSKARNLTINFDELSEQVGFNNRITFHRAFKQITGLPPNGFRKNS